jgi:hypothetical protein
LRALPSGTTPKAIRNEEQELAAAKAMRRSTGWLTSVFGTADISGICPWLTLSLSMLAAVAS